MSKKIGVVTWYNSLNYGTCLQCYALTQYLSSQGYDVTVPESFKYYYGLTNPVETLMVLYQKYKKIFIEKNNANNNDFFKKRIVNNNNFVYKYNNVRKFSSKADYRQYVLDTDVWITGSDQIWNPNYLKTPYLLSFVQDDKKKIAYSSSIGVNELPKEKIKFYKKYLSRFHKIAVRERTACDELGKILNRDIELVLDPVFLLDYEQWKKLFKTNEQIGIKEDNYIFCYFIGKNTKWIKEVEELSEKLQLPVKIAVSESKIMPDIGECLPDMGVNDFVSCINNAKCVITDSFHATALSIIFNKEFAVYKRFADNELGSQNSRLYDLLDMFNIPDRLINDENSLEMILKNNIMYENTNKIIKEKTEHSVKYLLSAIEKD